MRGRRRWQKASSVQSISLTFIGKAVGSPAPPLEAWTQGSRLRSQLLPSPGLTPPVP